MIIKDIDDNYIEKIKFWHKDLLNLKDTFEGEKGKIIFYHRILLAFSEYYYDKERNIYISLYINPKYRNMKLSKAILDEIIKDIYTSETYKKEKIYLWVKKENEIAIKSYKRGGFEVEDIPLIDYFDRYLMCYTRKEL